MIDQIDIHQVHQTLRNARAIQAEHGHTKHTILDDQGHVCMEGAILTALGVDISGPLHEVLDGRIRERAHASAMSLGFPHVGEMCAWNNQPERTLEEVLARFDEAIEHTEEPNGSEPAVEERELVTTP